MKLYPKVHHQSEFEIDLFSLHPVEKTPLPPVQVSSANIASSMIDSELMIVSKTNFGNVETIKGSAENTDNSEYHHVLDLLDNIVDTPIKESQSLS